jgi:hypothetical protein
MEFLQWLDQIPLGMAIFAALVIGLSPFFPEPHLWEKLKMLKAGTLTRPLDIPAPFQFSVEEPRVTC